MSHGEMTLDELRAMAARAGLALRALIALETEPKTRKKG
jgi:hypothetical protein